MRCVVEKRIYSKFEAKVHNKINKMQKRLDAIVFTITTMFILSHPQIRSQCWLCVFSLFLFCFVTGGGGVDADVFSFF